MLKWHYRIMKDGDEGPWVLSEVYADEDGKILGWTEASLTSDDCPEEVMVNASLALEEAGKLPPMKMLSDGSVEPPTITYVEHLANGDPA